MNKIQTVNIKNTKIQKNMETIIKNDLHSLKALIYTQMALEELDLITQNITPFIQERKRKLNAQLNWLTDICSSFTDDINDGTISNYIDIIEDIKKVTSSISLVVEDEN